MGGQSRSDTDELQSVLEALGGASASDDVVLVHRQVLVGLLEVLGGLVFVVRGQQLISVNEEIERITGYSHDELLSMSVLDIIHPEDHPLVLDRLTRPAGLEPQPGPYDVRLLSRSGEERWLSIVGRTVDAGSGPTVVGFALDITEFKKTQSALLQSEALFRTLAETTPAAIFLHRGEEMVYANPAAVEVSGYSQEELMRMSFWATVHPDDRQKVVERGLARQRGESMETGYEIRIVTKSGEERWLEIMGNPVMVDGQPSVLGTGLDITARKQAEQALRQSEELYRHLVETSPDAIIVTDVRGRLVMANQRTAELLRIESPEELLGRAVLALLADDDEDKARAATAETLESGAVHDLELRFLRSDGSEGLGEINVSRLDDAEGRPSAFLSVIRDTTNRRRAEEAMLRAEKLESVGLLAGGIAHDFNNIMTAILGNITLARRMLESSPEAAARRLDAAEQAVIDAKHLTQQLLTFSKGGEPITCAVDLGSLLRETTSLVLSGTNVEAAWDVPSDLPPVEADLGQITQLISNLVINAVQAMTAGGTVTVTARPRPLEAEDFPPLSAGDYVEFKVVDQGEGITEEQIGNVFDPYFTTKPGGTGLGLATCHSIVRRHGGAMSVESTVEVGSTFTVLLPASSSALPRVVPDSPLPETGTSGRVLIMDDEEVVREVAVEMLAEAGFDAEGARDGREAVELYQQRRATGAPFDVVILDLTVPGGMGGHEALERLRELDPEVQAIVSSGYSNDPIMSEHEVFGFCGVVTKPYTFTELRDVVVDLLGDAPS